MYATASIARIAITELHNLYPITNITRIIKSIPMRWTGNVECMGHECIEGFSKKIRMKEANRNVLTQMGG